MPPPTHDQIKEDLQGLTPAEQVQYMEELVRRFPPPEPTPEEKAGQKLMETLRVRTKFSPATPFGGAATTGGLEDLSAGRETLSATPGPTARVAEGVATALPYGVAGEVALLALLGLGPGAVPAAARGAIGSTALGGVSDVVKGVISGKSPTDIGKEVVEKTPNRAITGAVAGPIFNRLLYTTQGAEIYQSLPTYWKRVIDLIIGGKDKLNPVEAEMIRRIVAGAYKR